MTQLRARIAGAALLALSLTGTGLVASPAGATPTAPAAARVADHHKCTRTSSGKCIRGGEFCRQADYHHSGYDAKGHRYVCKGNKTHPHWEKP